MIRLGSSIDRIARTPWGVWAAAAVLVLLLAAAAAPQWLTAVDPYATDPLKAFLAPSFRHLFGTDYAGRDIFARVLFGARQSLIIGISATIVGLAAGLLLGLGSALSPRSVDFAIGRFIELLFVFPTVLTALILIAILGTGVGPLIIAVGVGTIPDNARLIRAQALRIKQRDFVVASRALGRTGWQVIYATIIPNVVRPIFVIATLGVGQAILWASSLSFLGLGAAPPSPEWGVMLADGRDYVQVGWWISLFPGLCITLATLSLTVVGHHFQQRGRG